MRCSGCQAENREGRRFCAGCGAPLARACPDCGFANEPDERFCGGCGAALVSGAAQAATAEAPQAPAPEAERRQLTVMFCDLVGSTGLSERLDPEDLRDVLRAYQKTCAEAIERYDGHIAKYIGDGLLVYFGYPQAHEDDAARAVRAGLALLAGIERLDRDLRADKDIALAVRLGIHTGLVVVGEMGAGELREDSAIVGETPNVAARLEALAEPNSVLIGARTYALVEG
ncbi:MAG: adenylate/guanylate cyclase domain-containing protein, partial [Kiloniellales bacterium]